MEGTFKARLTENDIDDGNGFTVEQFTGRPSSETPGDVGLCFSGGGSRALSAGMGQLRALAHLQLNGRSLLSSTKAISTVSGGSWLGVTFTYLTEGTADADFLNRFVSDPGRLVPQPTAGHPPSEVLSELPSGNIGERVNKNFTLVDLAIEALALWIREDTPTDFLWQALMGIHILEPYGLYSPGQRALPTSLFSADSKTLERDVIGPNPELGGVKAHLVASGADRNVRPFLICNTAMFLRRPGVAFRELAPVQATPYVTGIVGRPVPGRDANRRIPGGGGVTSFGFSSNL
ncbi:MAG: hypothetical protein AAFY88_05325, partial [Acidobacteriota bacterium]